MSWALIDDNVPTHPKFLEAGPAACWLWVCGVVYARKHHTNGAIPRKAISLLGVPSPRALIQRLVAVRLWDETADGWQVHDYQQQYGDDVEAKAKKEAERERKRLAGEKGGSASGVTRRNKAEAREAELASLLQSEPVAEAKQSHEALSSPIHSSTPVEEHGKPHPIREFLGEHERLFVAKFNFKPTKYNGKDAKVAQRVIERYGLEQSVRLLGEFFASTDEFIGKTGHGVNVFEGQINRLITARGSVARPVVDPVKAKYGPQAMVLGS